MNILAINGSPKGASGNTEILIRAFLEGAAQNNDIVETVYLKEKKIEHCIGCLSCWFKTSGTCVYKDDMVELLDKARRADILIFGSPMYFYNFTGIMKDFTDRLVPLWQPSIEFRPDGMATHPYRYADFNPKACVLISNSAFPEPVLFDGMKNIFESVVRGFHTAQSSTICCTGGVLLNMPEAKDVIAWYLEAVRKAGEEVAKEFAISVDTQAILDMPLINDPKAYADRANELWRSMGIRRL